MKQKLNAYKDIVIKYIKNYIKHNHLVLMFIFSNVLFAAIVRLISLGSVFNLAPYLADAAFVTAIASASFLVKKTNQFKYLMAFTVFFTFICFVNVVYYGYYTSFTSIQMLQAMNMLGDVSGSLTFNVFKIYQFVFILQPVSFYLYYKHLLKKQKKVKNITFKTSLSYIQQTLILFGVLVFLFILMLDAKDYSRLVKQWNREFIVQKFGIYTYQLNDLVRSIEPKISSMFGYDQAVKEYRNYYDGKTAVNSFNNKLAGKNILMIHTESIQNNILNLSFNDQEVTPTLNRMAREGLYFSNFYAQTSVGTSSDAEFIINTSLMPVSNGTVFISYADRLFDSMPKQLKNKGYETFSMHANNGTFWNRKTMHANLGYEKFYDKSNYKIDDVIGLGLSDKSFFKQSVAKMKKIKQPFYGTLIMLSNHTPFTETAEYSELDLTLKYNDPLDGQEKVAPYMEGTRLGEYFKSSNYADSAIGLLLDELDKSGMLDNTVVVIYGDHDAKLPKRDYNRMLNYDPVNDKSLTEEDPNYKVYEDYQYELNRKVPFIIWTKDAKLKKEITVPTGMIDVLPILGNLFGFNSKYQMGQDTTNVEDNLVALPNGNWISSKGYFRKSASDNLREAFIPFVKEPVELDYLQEKTLLTEQMINVSNALVVYDLERRNPLK